MLTIELELLGGRYAATSHHDRKKAEWPPHPARFYSALVAALYEHEPVDVEERKALEWLERQPPPALDVALEAATRDVHEGYVPVNDVSIVGDVGAMLRSKEAALGDLEASEDTPAKDIKAARQAVAKEQQKLAAVMAAQEEIDDEPSASDIKKAAALLPDRRTRQVRTFPVVVPSRSTFAFLWPSDVPSALEAPLDRLCERVTRLGHSSSLVRCLVVHRVATPTLVPRDDGNFVLRTVGEGQLTRLDAEFARHQAVESRILPARPQRYGEPPQRDASDAVHAGVFSDDWILFERVGGARPLSSRGTDLTRALRGALLETSGTSGLPPSISGHTVDGKPVEMPHVAFVALPFVGSEHADGSVQGCAIVLPREISSGDRETVLRLIARWETDRAIDEKGTLELASGTLPAVRVRRVEIAGKASVRPSMWVRPARRFVTATPIALDRNPGNLRSNAGGSAHRAAREAQQYVADACERIGLPRPSYVAIALAPLVSGSQPVRAFLPWPGTPGRPPRVRVHAEIRFFEPVRGPVLLGAGRYFGLGLCLPVGAGDAGDER